MRKFTAVLFVAGFVFWSGSQESNASDLGWFFFKNGNPVGNFAQQRDCLDIAYKQGADYYRECFRSGRYR